MKFLAAVSFILPSISWAEIVLRDGLYDARNCSLAFSDERVELRDNTLIFYETVCALSNSEPISGLDGAVLFEGICSGEGEEWSERYLLMPLRDGGLSVVSSHSAERYERCE